MKATLLHKLSAAVLIYATLAGSAFAQNLIICGGGVYCEEVRQECLAAGGSATLCQLKWRACVLDACPQR
ncbi:hypothetical protein [Stenotrophomonas sp. YAU14D1_LEIMI4_1]|uniref:hypothetical protein n=1 Tax=Stenotrophomonas sp. YAU14D1_LEIMI4_1 TaxID=2072407 RepID=UPI000D5412A5|nr:hypothetical protein [Stenotrophomonas sp. YAU14D1_LEIMI4_1]AWH27399.1 hypothetical protein C1932_16045 [Stenotrophomonas sp. YAU14D1_LEIMI4_1]HAL21231.1 hypothetical protein [Stenotrophomonas sp.]